MANSIEMRNQVPIMTNCYTMNVPAKGVHGLGRDLLAGNRRQVHLHNRINGEVLQIHPDNPSMLLPAHAADVCIGIGIRHDVAVLPISKTTDKPHKVFIHHTQIKSSHQLKSFQIQFHHVSVVPSFHGLLVFVGHHEPILPSYEASGKPAQVWVDIRQVQDTSHIEGCEVDLGYKPGVCHFKVTTSLLQVRRESFNWLETIHRVSCMHASHRPSCSSVWN
mmetsp:Transcript_35984/g.46236  ORF Transcript_35984/g.46236 Transcript_35984/m.46236 type:complete len:220 (-) Transcript_35984:1475-2134(-)